MPTPRGIPTAGVWIKFTCPEVGLVYCNPLLVEAVTHPPVARFICPGCCGLHDRPITPDESRTLGALGAPVVLPAARPRVIRIPWWRRGKHQA